MICIYSEFFHLLSLELVNPQYALFQSANSLYRPSPHSSVNPNHLQYFDLCGRMLARMICDSTWTTASCACILFTGSIIMFILSTTLLIICAMVVHTASGVCILVMTLFIVRLCAMVVHTASGVCILVMTLLIVCLCAMVVHTASGVCILVMTLLIVCLCVMVFYRSSDCGAFHSCRIQIPPVAKMFIRRPQNRGPSYAQVSHNNISLPLCVHLNIVTCKYI